MAIDRGNEATTQLLTLLNVSATRSGKRKWLLDDKRPAQKLNKRRNVQFGDTDNKDRGDLTEVPHTTENAEGDATMEEEPEVAEHTENDNAQGTFRGLVSLLLSLRCAWT